MTKFIELFEQIYQYKFPNNILDNLQMRTYHEKQPILIVGEKMDGFYFLISGSYYVTSPESNGKELLLRRCTAPSILGDIEIFQQCLIQSNCLAIEQCAFLFVPIQLYDQTLKFEADFTELLLKELSFKLKTCTTLSRVNALSSVNVKLAGYLCTIHSAKSPDEYLIVQNIKDVADLIGTTNRHVNRILKKWTDEHIIIRLEDSIKIIDFNRLEKISENIRYK